MSASEQGQSCLLALPSELRNEIWRMVLLQDELVEVDIDGYAREGLVNVCKSLRSETLKIYYYENKFAVSTPRYSPRAAVKWHNLVNSLGLRTDMRNITLRKHTPDYEVVTWWDLRRHGNDRRPHWHNLLEWLRLVHAGEVLGNLTSPMEYYQQGKTSRRSLIVKGMFATADDMKGLEWSLAEKIISHQRPSLGSIDERWMEDEALSDE